MTAAGASSSRKQSSRRQQQCHSLPKDGTAQHSNASGHAVAQHSAANHTCMAGVGWVRGTAQWLLLTTLPSTLPAMPAHTGRLLAVQCKVGSAPMGEEAAASAIVAMKDLSPHSAANTSANVVATMLSAAPGRRRECGKGRAQPFNQRQQREDAPYDMRTA